MNTQCTIILNHLKEFGSITQLEALSEYGIMRLASRISQLRGAGYPITSVLEHKTNRYGREVRYARYFMEEAQA